MTISEIAAQMGVTPETLVQEVVAQGTTKATAFVILGALAIVLAIVVLAYGIKYYLEICAIAFAIFALIALVLLSEADDLIAWKTAPQTTANQYIVEHYGGVQND